MPKDGLIKAVTHPLSVILFRSNSLLILLFTTFIMQLRFFSSTSCCVQLLLSVYVLLLAPVSVYAGGEATPPPGPAPASAPAPDAAALPVPTDTVKGQIPLQSRLVKPCQRAHGRPGYTPGVYCIGRYSYFTLTCPGNVVVPCPSGQRCREDPTVPASGKCVPTNDSNEANALSRLCQVFGDVKDTTWCVGAGGLSMVSCPGEKVQYCKKGCISTLPQKGKAECAA